MKKAVWLILTCSVLAALPVFAVCPSADLTGDCFVGLADFAVVAKQWLTNSTTCPSADLTGDCHVELADLDVLISQWLTDGSPLSIVWVDIDDPGVAGHEGFTGQMSKYETTNAQYCQFLNAAMATGDITVSGNYVKGTIGSNPGTDFDGQNYYNLASSGLTFFGATKGGATRIRHLDGVFRVDIGFENHPVSNVSWFGATAFCNYYGYRLPSDFEWQAVADYDGSYDFGCGTSININRANFSESLHPNGTTPVGVFGSYGYGLCDMAGNVFEFTSSLSDTVRVVRGGGWNGDIGYCAVTWRDVLNPSGTLHNYGFRVCR